MFKNTSRGIRAADLQESIAAPGSQHANVNVPVVVASVTAGAVIVLILA